MKKYLFFSDTHIGSNVSVAPPKYVSQDGISYPYTDVGKLIYNKVWKPMCEQYGPYQCAFALGDLVEGSNFAEYGIGCWNTDIYEQSRCAKGLFEMIPTKEMLCFEGTLYHGGKNPNGDRILSGMLSNAYWAGIEKSFTIKPDNDSELQDLVWCHAKHKIGHASKPSTEVSTLASEAERIHIDQQYYGDVRLIVRAHRHRSSHVNISGNIHGIVLPCFKGRDAYGRREVTQIPDLGFAVVTIEDKDNIDVKIKRFRLENDDVYAI